MSKYQTVSTSQMISDVANQFDQLPKKITKEVIAGFLNILEIFSPFLAYGICDQTYLSQFVLSWKITFQIQSWGFLWEK